MDIKDIINEKEKLEKDILKIINDFEEKTELTIDNIHLVHGKSLNIKRCYIYNPC